MSDVIQRWPPRVSRRLVSSDHTPDLDVVRQRKARGEDGLSNEEARAITLLGREQIKRLMRELREEGHVRVIGSGRAARWIPCDQS